MSPFKVPLPELDRLPLERRTAVIEDFNASAETAITRERLSKLPFRLGAVLMMPVMAVMVWGYDMGIWRCILAGFLCFAVGVPLGILFQMLCLKRAVKRYVHDRSI